ncbi:hypothetical protein NJB1604_14350 [Mycobacterium marinum]|nr:hypothetical protein NJB1604_14350 [Mycobacterium marinum]
MIEWSDTDLMMRDAVRQFIDREIRPNLDELETGALSPYPIMRKLFSQFGLDVLAAESVKSIYWTPSAPTKAKSGTEPAVPVAWGPRRRWPRCWCPSSPESASAC